MTQSLQEIRPASAALPTPAELEATVAQALEAAAARGASGCEAGVSSSKGLAVRVRKGEVETLEHMRDRGLAVTVYFGQRKGSASTADLSPQAVAETVAAACDIARHTAEDPCAGLPDPEWLAREVPDLDLDHPWELPPEEAIERARACEAAALAVDSRLTNSEGAELSTHRSVRCQGNSLGFMGGYTATDHGLSCVVLGREGDDMQRDYWYTSARDCARLEAAEAVGRRAGERTIARLGARRLGTATVPVIYAPEVARGLLGHFVSAIRGSALYRRASFLVDSVDEQIFPEFLTLDEDPHLPAGPGSAPFDGEGVATRPRRLVDAGVLQGYLLSTYSGRKLGLPSTGNAGGVHNLLVSPGERDFEGLLREMGRGLVVTSLMGQGVNPVTGDYSRGASGFWVEDGAIAYPVQEITVAGNLRRMFQDIQAVGRDLDPRGTIRTGSLLIGAMTVAGE